MRISDWSSDVCASDLVVSPGPDFAIVTRQSLAHGRAAGLWTAAGIGCGIVFHVSYGLFGLHWLTQTLPWAMTAIALGGAAFLIWLGCKALSAHVAPATVDAPPVAAASWQRNFAPGPATNQIGRASGRERSGQY